MHWFSISGVVSSVVTKRLLFHFFVKWKSNLSFQLLYVPRDSSRHIPGRILSFIVIGLRRKLRAKLSLHKFEWKYSTQCSAPCNISFGFFSCYFLEKHALCLLNFFRCFLSPCHQVHSIFPSGLGERFVLPNRPPSTRQYPEHSEHPQICDGTGQIHPQNGRATTGPPSATEMSYSNATIDCWRRNWHRRTRTSSDR